MTVKKTTLGNRCFFLFFVLFGCIYLTQDEGALEKIKTIGVEQIFHTELPGTEYTDHLEEQSQGGGSTDDTDQSTAGVRQPGQSPQGEGQHREGAGEDGIVQRKPDRVEYETVEDSYFSDALFLGDSRTVGMYEYGGLEDISTFYASTGLSVYKLFTAKIVEVPGQKKKITVEEALSEHQFAKIYLMLGINEMGTGTADTFLEKYGECLDHIRELQPDAIIYLQSIMQVTKSRSEQGDYVTSEGIDLRNQGIAAMADNSTVFFLNVNEAVCGEDGTLIAEYTHDGVHLKAQYISLWKDYLKTHAVKTN